MEKLAAVGDAYTINMKAEARRSSAGAYFGCLFLMMADERHKPVKDFSHEAYLANNSYSYVTCWS